MSDTAMAPPMASALPTTATLLVFTRPEQQPTDHAGGLPRVRRLPGSRTELDAKDDPERLRKDGRHRRCIKAGRRGDSGADTASPPPRPQDFASGGRCSGPITSPWPPRACRKSPRSVRSNARRSAPTCSAGSRTYAGGLLQPPRHVALSRPSPVHRPQQSRPRFRHRRQGRA